VLLHNFKNIFLVSELRKKLFFVLVVFAVFRFGSHITVPGVNLFALSGLFNSGVAGGLMAYFDLFSGGALRYFSIFALGIGPYISASIMMQMLTIMVPSLEALAKEGESGRKIIGQYTRYLTAGIALVQAFGACAFIERHPGLVVTPGWSFRLTTVFILAIGALFVMWLGEQINAHGIGNGSSMLMFAGIVARLPDAVFKIWDNIQMGQADLIVVALLLIVTVGVMGCVIFLEKGERKVPVQYAKRVVGHKVYGGQSSYIPLKINPAGVVPVIFSSAVLGLPLALASLLAGRWPDFYSKLMEWIGYDKILYNVLNAGLIVFFAYFYTAIIFNPNELADNLRKSGGFIPGIRPGKKTAEFFDYLLTRIGFPGALYLAALAILPGMLNSFINFPVIFSGVSLLIVIGVALDTSAQIESHLIERRYEGFLATGRLRGRLNR